MTGIWKARLGLWTWRPRFLCLQYNLGGTYSLVNPMVGDSSSARRDILDFLGVLKRTSQRDWNPRLSLLRYRLFGRTIGSA